MKSRFNLLPEVSYEDKFYGVKLKDNPNLIKAYISTNPTERRATKSTKSNPNAQLNDELLRDSHVSFLNSQTSHRPFYLKLQIEPHSKWKGIFDFLVLILANISSLRILYDICFQVKKDFTQHWLYLVIEILFSVFIMLQFFQQYQDPDTMLTVDSYKKIAMNYIKGWFIFDMFSTIPFDFIISSITSSIDKEVLLYIKMIRLVRLPKLVQTFDVKRFDDLAQSFYSNSDKSENGNSSLLLIFNIRYIFKIIRLVFMASILTYVIGCLWFVYCKKINSIILYSSQDTFYKIYEMQSLKPEVQLLICCYFTLTTLTTVGFGDYHAQNSYEEVFAIVIMLLGVAVFSYVMSSFTDQISIYNEPFGGLDKGSLLQNWLHLLNQYSRNKPFKIKLVRDIDAHFRFFWKNDRMNSIDKNNQFLTRLPKNIKLKLIDFFWLDLFTKFNHFFLYKQYREKYYKFYYEISFCFLPRHFTPGEVIYYQNDDVEEMYFVVDGTVSVGYSFEIENEEPKYHTKIASGDFFGGYYTLFNVKSEYRFISEREGKMFGINKFDLLKLVKNYPEINKKLRKVVYDKYKEHIKEEMDQFIIEDRKEKKQNYKPKPMLGIDENWNGMNVDSVLKDKIKAKENEINQLIKKIQNKYDEIDDKYKETAKKYYNVLKKCREDLKLIGDTRSKNNEEFYEGWLIK